VLRGVAHGLHDLRVAVAGARSERGGPSSSVRFKVGGPGGAPDGAEADGDGAPRLASSSHRCVGGSFATRSCLVRNACLDTASSSLLYFPDPAAPPFEPLPPEYLVSIFKQPFGACRRRTPRARSNRRAASERSR
jgi:hypothetical protein